MKQSSPYAFRDSDRVKEMYEMRTIKKGIESPFRDGKGARISMHKRTTTPKVDPVIPEDKTCFITQTNYIFPNILHRTKDKLDLGRYKAARSVENSRGTGGLPRSVIA